MIGLYGFGNWQKAEQAQRWRKRKEEQAQAEKIFVLDGKALKLSAWPVLVLRTHTGLRCTLLCYY